MGAPPMTGKVPALPAAKAAALAPLNEALGSVPRAMSVANTCRRLMEHALPIEHAARHVGRAKAVLEHLPHVPGAVLAHSCLLDVQITGPGHEVTFDAAGAMLSVLFGALSKRKADENAAMLMAACADMFDPLNRELGEVTGLWAPVCNHPAVLAIAIKTMLAKSVFTPSPSELRETMAEVKGRIDVHAYWLGEFLSWIETADGIVFEFDRPAWDLVYATLDGGAAHAMRNWLGEGPGDDEPATPRWQALDAIRKAKQAMLVPPEGGQPESESHEIKPARQRKRPAKIRCRAREARGARRNLQEITT
jgi:hypothetical protein